MDLLRRGGLRGAVGAGVPDDLPWSDTGVHRLVVGAAQAGADRAQAAGHLHCRPDLQPVWQVEPSGRDRHPDGGRGDDTLHRAAIAIGHAVLWCLCLWHARRPGAAQPRCDGDLGGGGSGTVLDPLWHPQAGCQGTASWRRHRHRGRGGGETGGPFGGGRLCRLGLGRWAI